MNPLDSTSTRPYLIRALYEWCTDNGLTPYVAVLVDDTVQVPNEYVKDGEIVLNISFDATSALKLGNDFIEFKARFAGSAREILVPISRVIAIYARENGQGMAFPSPVATPKESAGGTGRKEAVAPVDSASGKPAPRIVQLATVETAKSSHEAPPEPPRPAPGGSRPSLKRVK